MAPNRKSLLPWWSLPAALIALVLAAAVAASLRSMPMAPARSLLAPAALVALLAVALRFSLLPEPFLRIMGLSSSKPAAVSDVLKLDPPPGDAPSPPSEDIPMKDVESRLRSVGVDPALLDPSESDCRAALVAVSHPDFWRTHHSSHPNAKRVKAWLFVHTKYREQLDDLVKAAEDVSEGKDGAKTVPGLKLAAGKFRKKIARHSKFEDEQLFRFFKEAVCAKKGDENEELREKLQKLTAQHADEERQQSDAVATAIDAAVAASEGDDIDVNKKVQALRKVVVVLKSYQEDMLGHLELEERTLVGRWLGLTDKEYATYRGEYLKFPYSFMY